MLCSPVLMHPGHQQESLRGEGQGWEHPVCTLCIWDDNGWDCRMLSSTSLHQPHPGLAGSKAVLTYHCQAQLLPIWNHRVCLEVARGIFISAAGHTGKSDPDISLCKRKAKTPEKTFIDLSWSFAGDKIRCKWEHLTDMTARWEGKSEALQMLTQSSCRTCRGCHTCSLPFNIRGTKYLRLWEQDERSCPCPTQSEVKQGLLPSTCTLLLLPFV